MARLKKLLTFNRISYIIAIEKVIIVMRREIMDEQNQPMQLAIRSEGGKTTVILNGVPLAGLLSYNLSSNGPQSPVLFRCEVRIGSGVQVSLNSGADYGSGNIRKSPD